MQGISKALFIGRLTRDPETKNIAQQVLASVGIAVNRRRRSGNGEWIEEPNFFELEAWRETAEMIAKHAKKGDLIHCEAKIQMDSFEDRETGKRRTKTKFVVEPFSWQFLGGNPRSAAPDTAGITDSGEAAQAAKEDAAGNTPF